MNRCVFNRFIAVFSVFTALTAGLWAQETASRFFDSVSSRYESINDYTARLVISGSDKSRQVAEVIYKAPNMLRLDFSEPKDMVMAVDGETLRIWVPDLPAAFEQPLRRNSQAAGVLAAGSQGLELMKKYYTVAYAQSPSPVPLDPGSSEYVVKLRLVWKSNNEGFRQLELSIDNDKRIRRIVGITTGNEVVQFDFTNIMINRGIPAARFQYDPPPTGNTIENFLFDPES